MTKKHFKQLAQAIAKIENLETRRWFADLIGHICKEDNPRFQWAKWDEACHVKGKNRD
jgi:hypothetical protein